MKRISVCGTVGLLALIGATTIAPAAGPAYAYVSDERAGIDVIDLDALAVVRTFPTGGTGPRGIAVTVDGRYLLAANKITGDMSALDRSTGAVKHKVKIGLNPEFVRVNGHFAYVTYEPESPPREGAGKGETAGKDDGKPAAGGDKPGGKDDDDDAVKAEIAIVDLDHWRVVRRIVSGHETEGVEFSKNGRDILVTNEGDDTVSVYDRTTGKTVQEVNTASYGKRPRGIKALPDGSGYVVTLEYSDKLIVLDDQFKVVKEAPTKGGPYGVAFTPDGSKLLVAAAKAGVLQVFDAKTYEVVGEIPVGKRCWHFTFTPDGGRVLAACGRSDAVYVADASTYATVKVLEGAQGPWGIVTWPKSNGTLDTPK